MLPVDLIATLRRMVDTLQAVNVNLRLFVVFLIEPSKSGSYRIEGIWSLCRLTVAENRSARRKVS